MGYLEGKDYRKIKNIIETFIDTPVVIDNLFKSLVLFLDTKNTESTIMKTEKVLTPISGPNMIRLKNELENADIALDKFTEKLIESNVKRKRKANSEVVS